MEALVANWPLIVATVERGISFLAAAHVLMYKRDTRATLGWVGLVWLAPFVGSALYFFLGINRIKRKGNVFHERLQAAMRECAAEQRFDPHGQPADPPQDPHYAPLAEMIRRLTGRSLAAGNAIRPLVNGDQAYAEMLAAIERAQRSVALQTYIFDYDRAGREFCDALFVAQRRGVQVRVLVDDVGARYSRPTAVSIMRQRGIPCETFLKTMPPRIPYYANLRNHRKILVVDGVEGFAGGMNIREGCLLQLAPSRPVQDLHFHLAGPVVSHLQQTFVADWAFTTGELLTGNAWLQAPPPAGPGWARGIADGPDEDFEKLLMTILGALSLARKRVTIVTPYFLPDTSVIHALGVAALRGVEVMIVLPQVGNNPLVQWACSAMLWQVLERGCRVVQTAPPFDHTKLMLVDDAWVLFGSTNWDPRSLRLNFEFNVECYDPDLNTLLAGHVAAKVAAGREVTLAMVDSRPLPVRLRDGLARLFTPYL